MKALTRGFWLALGCLIVLTACDRKTIEPEEITVTGISVSPTTLTLMEGESEQLAFTLKPSNATHQEVEWTSQYPKVATVSPTGVVSALQAGSSKITVKSPTGGVAATCLVTVKPYVPPAVAVTGVSLDITQQTLEVGASFTLTATVTPDDADNKDVNWFTSNGRVASVDKGTVTAVGAGEAVITVSTLDGGFQATCTVTVPKSSTPSTIERWKDTGADLPDYPNYNKVSSQSDFPRIDITWSSAPTKDWSGNFTYVENCTVTFKDPKKMYSDITEYGPLKMKIKGRGNTTWNAEGGIKNPYRFKLYDHPAQKIFGLNRDKDWILLADVQDPTLLRNAVAFRISRMVSMPWTPKYRAVELYVNGSYYGCYLLVEAKETDIENKVPVAVSETGEVDSGYYIEIDDKWDSDEYFYSQHFGKKIKYKDPESPTQEQKDFIEGYVNEVEKLLKDKKFDKTTGYWSKMEVGTFIDQFIVQELTMNVDGNMRLSTYFAKDSDTKLFMPMVWDFDLSLGNCTYLGKDFDLPYIDGSRDGPKGWFVKIRGGYPGENYGKKDTYYQYLFLDPQFVQAFKDRWEVVKPRLDKIPAFIDKMTEYNKVAYDHNASAGKNPRGTRWREYPPDDFKTWSDAADWLKDWYSTRLEWLDGEIKAL